MSVSIEFARLNNHQQAYQLEALLHTLQNDEFNEFEKILKQGLENDIDINHSYPDQGNKTLLDIACSSIHTVEYVDLLLKNGANVNLIGSHGAAPIHLAVLNSDWDTVKLLVDHKDINIELENKAHETAFYLAVKHKRKDLIPLLQEYQAKDMQLKKREILNNINIYSDTDYETEPFLTEISESYMHDGSLFLLLRQGNYEAFVSIANEHNVKLEDNNLEFTYLQYACKLGLTKFVKRLLDLNADPNETVKSNGRPPIVIASFYGYHNIVRLLLDAGIIAYDFDGRNVLYFVMKRICHQKSGGKIDRDNSEKCDYLKCSELFLKKVPHNLLNINSKDVRGVYPLEYAVYNDKRDLILLLLERGAYIGVPTELDKPLIQCMAPSTLEYFLDGSMNITKSWAKSGSTSFSVIFNYNWLTCTKKYLSIKTNETKPLLAMSEESELKPYLKHPSLLVFFDLKWHIIMRTLYFMNLAIHLPLFFCLMCYLRWFNYLEPKDDKILVSPCEDTLWHIIFIGNNFTFVKEITQFLIYTYLHPIKNGFVEYSLNAYEYEKDYKNWMEITRIILTYVILLCKIQSIQNRAALATTATIVSFLQVSFLILSHPSLSMHTEMKKAVASSISKFLILYLVLLLAFASQFYSLFIDTSNNTMKTSSFNNVTQCILERLTMQTSNVECDTSGINDEYNWILIIFIFQTPILLFNLMNSIVVDDIQKITKDIVLVEVMARVKLITHMEEMISTLFSFLDRLANYCNRPVEMKLLKYYTYYFCITSNRKIRHNTADNHCTADEQDGLKALKFAISAITRKSIREACAKAYKKSSATDRKEETVNTHQPTVEVTQEAATPQEVCKCPETLKSVLERFEERLKIIELKLTENTKLSNQKFKYSRNCFNKYRLKRTAGYSKRRLRSRQSTINAKVKMYRLKRTRL